LDLRAATDSIGGKAKGRKIDPEEEPVGILSHGMSGRSRRAFDFLKVAQYELMERALKQARNTATNKTEVGKQIADGAIRQLDEQAAGSFFSVCSSRPQTYRGKMGQGDS